MSRRLNKVMVATVFVVAFVSFIPLSSGAELSDSTSAHISITFQIPDKTPPSVKPVPDTPDPDLSTPPKVVSPSPDDAPPKTQPDPVVVQPPIPEPVVDSPPTVPDEPTHTEPPVAEPQPSPQPSPSPTPTDPEGSLNEEVSP